MGKARMCMTYLLASGLTAMAFYLLCLPGVGWGEEPASPLEVIKSAELAHKDVKGEVYLGKVLVITYPINSARVGPEFQKLLQELADVLKTPERKDYRVVLKGYTDSTGPTWLNMRLSRQRAEAIKRLLVEKFRVDPRRIVVEGHGPENPVASNKTPSGRAKNRRTEVHLYGDVSEAVKFLLPPPEKVAKKEEPAPELVKPKRPPKVAPPKVTPPRPAARGTIPPAAPLPKALEGIEVKDYYVPAALKKAGLIHAMEGHVVVLHRATSEAYWARPGDIIYENDAVYTLADSRCRIRFFDDDVISMAANTHFAIDTYVDQRKEKEKKSFFSMLKGKVMFYALRLFRYRTMAFKVNTPTAVVGVRGTKFGIHVYWEEDTAARALPAVVAGTRPMGALMASNGQGTGKRSFTDAFCEDGEIGVDGSVVPAGYIYDGKSGKIRPTDPFYLEQFEKETGVGEGKREGVGERPPEKPLGIPLDPVEGDFADATDSASSDTNEQNTLGAGPDMGYFSAFLTRENAVGLSFRDAYLTSARQDFSGGSISAPSFLSQGGSMTLAPGFVDNSTSYLSRFTSTRLGTLDSGDLGTQYPLTVTEVGSNAYMEWGYWTMTTPVPTGADTHYVNNPAWYIFGQITPNDVISGLSGVLSYSGSAHGTFFSTAGGIRLDGSFNCQVDFGAGTVADFDLNVADSSNQYQVSILNASGAISNGQFSLNNNTGTWTISSPAVPGDSANGSANGTFYGPVADHVGGAWGVEGTAYGERAAGVFQGSR